MKRLLLLIRMVKIERFIGLNTMRYSLLSLIFIMITACEPKNNPLPSDMEHTVSDIINLDCKVSFEEIYHYILDTKNMIATRYGENKDDGEWNESYEITSITPKTYILEMTLPNLVYKKTKISRVDLSYSYSFKRIGELAELIGTKSESGKGKCKVVTGTDG
jgi:hypothetical protein